MSKILVVEDDALIQDSIILLLESEQHEVEASSDGIDALQKLRSNLYDAIVMDWNLPNKDGPDIVREYREDGGKTPILLLTAKASYESRAEGLDAGADDYLTKPFNPKELMARVRALLRRSPTAVVEILHGAGIDLDPSRLLAIKNGTNIQLLPKESQVLEYMMRNPNRVLESSAILRRVWSKDPYASKETLAQTVKTLCAKIDPSNEIIQTIENLGYTFRHTREESLEIQSASKMPSALGSNNAELLNRANLNGTSLASRYEFLDFIGEGAVGIVFKARNPSLDKLVAIKMLLMSGLKNEALIRFSQEAKMIGRLDHPGIATVYDFGVTERGQSFMVMEYVEGRTLSAILKQCFNLPVKLSLHLSMRLCESIAHAHSKGIIHRDLKPSNIMVKEIAGMPPSTKLLDFGCGKFRDLRSEQVDLTQEGSTLGSPPYMSPEQVRGKAADERSDIYSLGCIMYEMLTGYPPFMGTHPNEIMLKHLDEAPAKLQVSRPEITFPEGLEQLVAKALAKDPAERYQTTQELLDQIKKLLVASK